MADGEESGARKLTQGDLVVSLFSSSTKRRIAALATVHRALEAKELSTDAVKNFLSLLFETYPLYVDRSSRQAAQQCIVNLAESPEAVDHLPQFIESLKVEAAKSGIAPANAFVLTEWCSALLPSLAKQQEAWNKWGIDVVRADAQALATCLGSDSRGSIKKSALVVTRRAFRRVFREELGKNSLRSVVSALSAKSSTPTAKNAPLLGVIAGVSSRLPDVEPLFKELKKDYFGFYIREIIGSRTVLPPHIADGLRDLFQNFTTLEDLQTDLIPAIEKALLRAPEVVLNDLVSPMVRALPPTLDLSEILHQKLLKPLLSNTKSTNPTIRAGALKTFEAVVQKSSDEATLDKVADELLTPLRQGKVPGVDQKVLHSQMLASLPSSSTLAKKVPTALASVALKEPNEVALDAETKALAKHLLFGLQNGLTIEAAVADSFAKGLADKKLSVRRIWALRSGDLFWSLSLDKLTAKDVLSFISGILGKMASVFNEVVANPLPSVQSGAVVVAYVFTALCLTKFNRIEDQNVAALVKKAAISKHVLVAEGKPSFLLNFRVYTKLSAHEDLTWGIRALAAVTENIAQDRAQSAVEDAWSQAFIYFVTASIMPPNVRKEATKTLTNVYYRNPARIGSIVVTGLWEWRRRVDVNEKDTAATAAKAGNAGLRLALHAICPPLAEVESSGAEIDPSILQNQLIQLLILCRPELIPQASWIDTCLRVGVDPGDLVSREIETCLQQITTITESYADKDVDKVHSAACRAAADLAFVAPEAATPRLVKQIQQDLSSEQMAGIGTTEASIYRTPEGTLFVDVLASSSRSAVVDKKAKDYDTLKWEEELRAQIGKKTGQTRKLTPEEQTKVKAQIAKESAIRKQVRAVHEKLKRGVGIIHALATGPPTEAELWIVQAVDLLHEIIEAGAGLILGDAASLAYLDCSRSVTSRLGSMRQFVGVATLRAIGVTQLPAEFLVEPLEELVTRVLYRVRILGEQRPFDTVSLAYMLPLMFLVLQNGGFAAAGSEAADEQLVLATEFLACHTDAFVNERLPRRKLLEVLISSMQRYNQHYKLVKDCFQDLCRSIDPNLGLEEISVIVEGTILPQASVRIAVLQAIDAELDLSEYDFLEQIWIACHDVVPENAELARTIWEESEFHDAPESSEQTIRYLESPDKQLRRAAARTLAETISNYPKLFTQIVSKLKGLYIEKAKPRVPERDEYGVPRKTNMADLWEARSGVALALKELAPAFDGAELVSLVRFLIDNGPLGDHSDTVRDEMIDAATTIIAAKGAAKVEELMELFENALESPDRRSETFDKINEAVVILYGALARHLKSGDKRVPKVVQRLLTTLSTPSESVQYAVAECLPPLVRTSQDQVPEYVQQMLDELLKSKKYATRRGAAYGLAGIVSGKGISVLQQYRILSTLKGAAENKKDASQRQGVYLAYELLSTILGRTFEPYVIQIVPQLLAGFGDSSPDVREACLDASKACFANLSSFGVKQILPTLLEGLEEDQWRSKKGACDLLGAMAYLDPQQLALSLPDIIPPLTNVLTDSHKEVRLSANRSLQRFGEVINNPEIKSVVNILLKALSDPTKYTDDALDSLIKVHFVHFLDAPSLALVVRILERGLADRSSTKRKSSQIIGSLAHLTERKDLVAHLPILVAGLRVAIVDPVPATRATASKALGSTIEKLGEDALPDLIPSLMSVLKSDTGAGDRLGSAQALSEVLAGLGTTRLEETLPTILQNVSSSKASVREGFMSLFIFLPACFGNSFSNYLSKIIPPILTGLADEVESIRETALRAGRLLVKNFSSRSIDLLLPELERGLADDNYRIRLSSVELVGDLLFNLTGITARVEQDDAEEGATEAGQSLLEVLGEERRNRVLSAIYICRCDTSGLVRSAAINVWKALVATPRTLREIIPTLTQLIIRRIGSSNMEQKLIAGNALGELIRKAGEGVLASLLPTLEEALHTPDADAKQGICIALREIISSASPDTLEDYEKTLIAVVQTALVDSNADVREAAAEAFDSLQKVLGKKSVDDVFRHLLNLLREEGHAQNALSALLTLLTDSTRSNVILPTLLPSLIKSPMSVFNAKAIASLAEVAIKALTRSLPKVFNALMDNLIECEDPELREELSTAFDVVLSSVDADEGLSTAMSAMLGFIKHDDHRRRSEACRHLTTFFEQVEIDATRYYPDLIRALLLSFDDRDTEVVKTAWAALNALTKRLRKEEMESLVVSTRQVLLQVGVPGANLRGFELPKGINAILPIFYQGLTNGTTDQRTQAALALSDIVDRASSNALKPFVTHITGALIRVVSDRSADVKAAILFTLNNLLDKIPTLLKPFLPQLQRTFAKALADTSSEVLRTRAAKALGTLITLTPRIDPLISELVTGAKSTDPGVKNAMLKALYEVVSKAGSNMNEVSRNLILGLIDAEQQDVDDSMMITNAKLIGALVKVLPADTAAGIIKSRVLAPQLSKSSTLSLNAVLAEAAQTLEPYADELPSHVCQGLRDSQPFIQENSILAAGKYLLAPSTNKSYDTCKTIFQALAAVIPPGNSVDSRRLALVVLRTVSRENNDLIRPHLALLVPPIFASVRDLVIPVKLSAEAAFLTLFSVVEEESAVFEKYMAGPGGSSLPPNTKRSMQDYFRRIALRLANQARERREAEGGQGGLGLASDEKEDEREVWSVGRVDLGEGSFED
ncbi:translational activator [Trichodelitschia bisporula]|uniref:eIF-2-alpha kinase activator GCN1 n=1 Tax=Trichodelitschia bisporula TaxID=703511 RepID=A0A6G1I2I0_9PEZI|nr:translational activator [Trichodelitschia bisporula]